MYNATKRDFLTINDRVIRGVCCPFCANTELSALRTASSPRIQSAPTQQYPWIQQWQCLLSQFAMCKYEWSSLNCPPHLKCREMPDLKTWAGGGCANKHLTTSRYLRALSRYLHLTTSRYLHWLWWLDIYYLLGWPARAARCMHVYRVAPNCTPLPRVEQDFTPTQHSAAHVTSEAYFQYACRSRSRRL